MSKIKIKLKPQNGVKVKTQTTYLFDPTLEQAMIDLSKDWAIKTDGMVEEDGVPVDYSAKAYAIGGTGTETNNSKYYAELAATSETNAASSASSASASAISASASAGVATTKAGEAATSATNSANSATSASNSATSASNSATAALGYASTASGHASTAATQAGIASTQAGVATTKASEASASATNAASSASSASTSASNANVWAEGADVQVQVLGGEHSSKGWAKVAKDLVDSLGSVLRYKGSVATYADLPTTGQETGDMWNVLEDDANYAWSGTAWDRLSGVVDLTPYRTANDQDTIDSGKVDKVSDANKVYGTDSSGNQTTYSKDSFGQVDDVQVNGVSVVTSKIANIDLTGKQDVLTSGTGIDITSNVVSNSGVRSVSTGATNGTISVNTNGTSAEVSVYGLGSAAYTASTSYATAAQGAKADTAVQPATLNNYVPTSRTVNGKALSANITLTYSDVGASQPTIFRDWS